MSRIDGFALDLADRTGYVRGLAQELGFDFCRFVPIGDAPHSSFFSAWLARGGGADMAYLGRHVDKRGSPGLLARGGQQFRSMIVVGVDYGGVLADPRALADPSRGLIARYAWSPDYHEVMRPALYALDGEIRRLGGRSRVGKALVDTGPVLERDWAMLSGLGFTGKNCCTIHPERGSFLLLGTLCVPEVFEYDVGWHGRDLVDELQVLDGLAPGTRVGRWEIRLEDVRRVGTCGGCVRCLSACPTDAFVGPLHLDARRCISYWTIESRGVIPLSLRSAFGNRIFGCDICQDVCPWNRRLAVSGSGVVRASALLDRVAPPLIEGFRESSPYWLADEAFSVRFQRTPVLRPGRAGMLRNVCVALGNWADAAALPCLLAAVQDRDPVPRAHAAWALGRLARAGVVPAADALLAALDVEPVDWVQAEIRLALA